MQMKFIIVADGSGPGNRVIGGLGVGHINDTDVYTGISRNIDGPPSATGGVLLRPGAWHSLQYELKPSSSPGSDDARLAIWLNEKNANYASPSTTTGNGWSLGVANWNNVNLGYFTQTTLVKGGRFVYSIADDVEWADTFDPAWHRK